MMYIYIYILSIDEQRRCCHGASNVLLTPRERHIEAREHLDPNERREMKPRVSARRTVRRTLIRRGTPTERMRSLYANFPIRVPLKKYQ